MIVVEEDLGARRPPPANDDTREAQVVMGGFVFFQSMMAAIELGVFDHLEDHPGSTLDELHVALKVSRHGLRTLLLACSSVKLLRRDEEGRYTNGESSRFAWKSHGGNIRPMLRAFQELWYPAMARTAESVRTGVNKGLEAFPGSGSTLYERLAGHPELEKTFHDWMNNLVGNNHEWLDLPEIVRARRVLDPGGGTGTNSILLAERCPDAHSTIMDIPTVCARARERVSAAGLSARISVQEGDFVADPFPGNLDAVLLLRICNIYSIETNRRLIEKSYRSLNAGGVVVIFHLFSDDSETGSVFAALLSMYFHVLATGEGMVYPVSDYVPLFESAGFSQMRVYRDPGMIVAVK